MLRYTLMLFSLLWMSTLVSQTYTLAGQVLTDSDDAVGDVTISLLDANNELITSQTIDCGQNYTFSYLQPGQEYYLHLDKEEGPLNGISTFDLVLLSKHILGVQELSNDYKKRTADVDDSGSLDILDIMLLRSWVLNLQTVEYPENAWLFFQPTAGTEGPQFPIMLMADQLDYDFVAIKRGDVNGTADPCF